MTIVCTGTLLNRIITAQWEGMRGYRVGEVRASITSPMPDHKGFDHKVLSYSNCQNLPTPFLSEFSEI